MIKDLGIKNETEVIVTPEKGSIIITPSGNKRKINMDLSTWEAQFKDAIKLAVNPKWIFFKKWKISLIRKNGKVESV